MPEGPVKGQVVELEQMKKEYYRLRGWVNGIPTPEKDSSRTKMSWITFYNDEAEEALKEYLGSFDILEKSRRLFSVSEAYFRRRCKAFERKTGIRITPQILREWFACEMGRLGVPDRYVDAYCGRVPRSVLARHYTDFSPEKLKEIYEKADLKVLS